MPRHLGGGGITAAAIRGGIYDLFDVSRSASDGDGDGTRRTRRGLDGAGIEGIEGLILRKI